MKTYIENLILMTDRGSTINLATFDDATLGKLSCFIVNLYECVGEMKDQLTINQSDFFL